MDGAARAAWRVAPHQGRSGLGPRDRGGDAPRAGEKRPGGAVREHQRLRQRPLHETVRQRARREIAPGAGARLSARRHQSRPGAICDEEKPRDHCAGARRQRAGERSHRPRQGYRPDRISGAEMALPRRRPLHPHLLLDRHQGSRHRRDECRHVSRHDRAQGHRAVPPGQRRPALGRAFRQMGGARQADAGRLRDRLGSDHVVSLGLAAAVGRLRIRRDGRLSRRAGAAGALRDRRSRSAGQRRDRHRRHHQR